jgi:hypothetical protein
MLLFQQLLLKNFIVFIGCGWFRSAIHLCLGWAEILLDFYEMSAEPKPFSLTRGI